MGRATYRVKTAMFEGPLDVLLSLIESRKLQINDVSLASVTDDFIAYVKSEEELPLNQVADFILTASTLLLIKSKSLLPVFELSEEEQGDIEDLERRLALYQRFKSLSRTLIRSFGIKVLFSRLSPEETPIFSPDQQVTIPLLLSHIHEVIATFPKPQYMPEAIVKKVMNLEEIIEQLMERMAKAFKMSFRELTHSGTIQKTEIILSFLALLELVKRGVLSVTQERHFSDIVIERASIPPGYTG